MDDWDFEFPIVPFVDVEGPGNATVLHGLDAAYVVAHSDAPYPGQDTYNNPNVGVLDAGQSISSIGITCEATESAITCANDSTRHGFMISRSGYEVY